MSHTHTHPDSAPTPMEASAGAQPQDEGWLSVEDMVIGGKEPPEGRIQITSCWRTGGMFIRAIRGRYEVLSPHEIASRPAEIRPLLDAMGLVIPRDPELSPSEHLEYLENVLEFEMTCPCGCAVHPGSPPELH